MSPNLLIFIALCLFLLLCLNVFLRFKVFKIYNRLAKNKVNFSAKQMMDKALLEKEVIPRYPEYASDIRIFSKNVRLSIWIATVMLVFILYLGWILIKNR